MWSPRQSPRLRKRFVSGLNKMLFEIMICVHPGPVVTKFDERVMSSREHEKVRGPMKGRGFHEPGLFFVSAATEGK